MAKKIKYTGCLILIFIVGYIVFNSLDYTFKVEISSPHDRQSSVMSAENSNAEAEMTPSPESKQIDMTNDIGHENGFELSYYTEGQLIDIMIDYYYGYWLIGEMAGDGYVYADIDPADTVIGGILSISKDRAVFYGPQNTMVLDNPKYSFVLQNPPEFASTERASYSSFDFPNTFVVQMFIYDGNELWRPEALGPFWIKDMDTMFVRHSAFYEMKRVDSE